MEDNTPKQEWNPMLVFHLTLADVNAVLNAISKAPLEQVFNVYMAIRTDAERQIAVLKANAEKVDEPVDDAGE